MNLTKTKGLRLGILLLAAFAITSGDTWSQRPRRPFPRRAPATPSKPKKKVEKKADAPEPKKLAVINNTENDFLHVIRFIRIFRDYAVEFFFLAI